MLSHSTSSMHGAILNWQSNPETWTINKYGTARIGYALLIITSVATSAIDLALGLGIAVLNLLSAGTSTSLSSGTKLFLVEGGRCFLSEMCINLLRFINPNAPFSVTPHVTEYTSREKYEEAIKGKIFADGDGFLTGHVSRKLISIAKSYQSRHLVIAHTVPRLIYILNIPISIICRVIDFAIGIIAAVFAILAIGKSENLNNIAYRGFSVGAMVADIIYNLTKVINPWAEPLNSGIYR